MLNPRLFGNNYLRIGEVTGDNLVTNYIYSDICNSILQ